VWRFIRRGLIFLVFVLVAGGVAMVRLDRPAAEVAARWGTPPSRFIDVDGMRVHVRERGTGPALLLLHGSNASLFTWEGWARELSGEHRVIALDLPGHGLTGPHPQDRYTARDMAEVVDHAMTALGVERFSLAGNSMGGHIAVTYALAHPERVENLILVDAAGLPREEPRPLIFRLATWPVVGLLFGVVTPRFIVAANVRAVYGDPSKVTDETVDRYYDLLLREGNRRATRLRLSQADEPVDAGRLRELRMPVLILWGARDRWILPKYGERYRDAIPGAKLVVFDALGHVPMEEDPVATAAAVRDFIRR
jgi:pimeloyl-ACP methyl ester carboxylesterase